MSARYDDSGHHDEKRHLEDMMLAVRSRKEGNQYCADCGVPSPEYVNITIGTFICEVCADIHRSTSKRQVKDIFAGPLSSGDIRRMEAVGNEVANRRFLATWNPDEIPQPDRSNRQELREFLWLKYDGSFKKPTPPTAPPPQPSPRRTLTERTSSSQLERNFSQNPAAQSSGRQQGQSQQSYWASRFAPPSRSQSVEHPQNSMDEYFSHRPSSASFDSAYRSTMPTYSDRFQPPVNYSRSAYVRPPPNLPPPPPSSRHPMYAPRPPPPSNLPYEHVNYDYRRPPPQQPHHPYPDEDPYGQPPPYTSASLHYDPYGRPEHDSHHDDPPRRTKQKSRKKDKTISDYWEDNHVRRADRDDDNEFDDDTASGSASSRPGKKHSTSSKKSSKKKGKDNVTKSTKSNSVKEPKNTKTKRRSTKYDDSDDSESDEEIVKPKKKSNKKKSSNTSDQDADSISSTSADGLDRDGDSGKPGDATQNKSEFDLMSEWMGDSKETDGSTSIPPSTGAAGLNGTHLPNMVPLQGMQMPSAYQTAAPMPMMPLNMYGTVMPGLMPPFPPQGAPFLPGMSMHPNMAPLPGLMAGMQGLAINPAAPPPNFAVPPQPSVQNQQQLAPPPPPPLGMPAGPPPGPPPGGPPNE